MNPERSTQHQRPREYSSICVVIHSLWFSSELLLKLSFQSIPSCSVFASTSDQQRLARARLVAVIDPLGHLIERVLTRRVASAAVPEMSDPGRAVARVTGDCESARRAERQREDREREA